MPVLPVASLPSTYWLRNAHVPAALLTIDRPIATHTREGLVSVDLKIQDGVIHQIQEAASSVPFSGSESDTENVDSASESKVLNLDLRRGIIFPCFVDLHTHLDKGHIWERSPNLDGTFDTALTTVRTDSLQHWTAEDVHRRMEFGLNCSYAHGTAAIRTHIDSFGEQAEISFGVFQALQETWRDRLTLQAVCLVTLDYFLTPEGEQLADRMVGISGLLGCVVTMTPDLDQQLDHLFRLAIDRQLNLDFHTDETGDPQSITLRHIAQAALRHQFTGQIVCGHCCSLSVQSAPELQATLDAVRQARIGIVSLPMCNLYLQDRDQAASQQWAIGLEQPDRPITPRWRGVAPLHEIRQWEIPVAVASDNCRDPFYGFGDHDGLEVFTQAVRIAQLDAPYGDWCRMVTQTPAELMGLPTAGRIAVGLPADLVLFKARYYSELLARPQADRTVLRQGQAIDTTLPDYAELDTALGIEDSIH